jgi:hypothetical protein
MSAPVESRRDSRQIRTREVANAATYGNKRVPEAKRWMDRKSESSAATHNDMRR